MKTEDKSAWRTLVDEVKELLGIRETPRTIRLARTVDENHEGQRIGFPARQPAYAKIPK